MLRKPHFLLIIFCLAGIIITPNVLGKWEKFKVPQGYIEISENLRFAIDEVVTETHEIQGAIVDEKGKMSDKVKRYVTSKRYVGFFEVKDKDNKWYPIDIISSTRIILLEDK